MTDEVQPEDCPECHGRGRVRGFGQSAECLDCGGWGTYARYLEIRDEPMTNPTPMDIIMERGLSGEEAWARYEFAVVEAPVNTDLMDITGVTKDEYDAWRRGELKGAEALDQIIQARRAKEEKAEGPDLEAAKALSEMLERNASQAMTGDYTNLARSYLQVIAELETLRELHRPRHTADGEWPEEDYLLWDDGWVPMDYDEGVPGTWLPAPPKPTKDSP